MGILPKHSFSVRMFYVVCATFIFFAGLQLFFGDYYVAIEGERGIVESINALAFFLTGLVLLFCGTQTPNSDKRKKWMFFGAGIVFLWVTGEETSWGQHWWGHSTPEWLAKINGQGETNVHNINKKFFDRVQERSVALLAFLSCVMHFRRQEKILDFRVPDFAIALGFLLLPFYRRWDTMVVDLWTIGPVFFILYIVMAYKNADKKALWMCASALATALICFYPLYYRTDLLGGRSNNVHEIREMLFSVLCCVYAIQLWRDENYRNPFKK